LTFIAPIIAISRMVPGQLFRDQHAGPVAAHDAKIIDGLRYVRQRADLMMPIILMLIVGTAAFNFQITLALMAKNVFHTQADRFGLLTTCLAVGALAGALAGSARKGRPSAWVVLGSCIAFTTLEAIVGFAPTFLTTAILLVPTGFFMIFFAQATNQRVQMGVSPEFRGRVMALYVMVFLGTTPISAPLVGWVSAAFGPRTGIWLGALIALVTALIVLSYELRRTGGRLSFSGSPLRVRVLTADPIVPVAVLAAAADPVEIDPVTLESEETQPVRAA
ncbi:MAG TPA: MFS transporter, partial [Micromonosporaceae bacterium]